MIKLVSLLERVEITPEGNLRIPSVDDISLSQWARINRIMVQKGYDMRGAEDCKQSVTKFLTNPHNSAPDVIDRKIYKDWVETIATVMHLKDKSNVVKGDYDCKQVLRAAMRHFGAAYNILNAGYILPNGFLINLSSGTGGGRDLDHREIATIYSKLGIKLFNDNEGSAFVYVKAFMRDCRAIRTGGNQPFVEMWHEPTQQQIEQLRHLFKIFNGYIILVVKSQKYGNAEQQYKKGTSPNKILQDIITFYRTGEFPDKLFENIILKELKETDLSSKDKDHKYILIYKENLFILDENSNFTSALGTLELHPGYDKYVSHSTDVYDFLQMASDMGPDVLVGEWLPNNKALIVWSSREIIPQTSLQVKKAAQHLGVKVITYRYLGSVESGDMMEKDIPIKKIKGEIPRVMYHGTSNRELESILKWGLDPTRGTSNFTRQGIYHPYHIFLAANFEAAQFYAWNAAQNNKSSYYRYPVILEIKVPDPNLLAPDYDADITAGQNSYYDRDNLFIDKASMKATGLSRETGKWGYKGRIPATFITWIHYYNAHQRKWHKIRRETLIRLMEKYDWEIISLKLGIETIDS